MNTGPNRLASLKIEEINNKFITVLFLGLLAALAIVPFFWLVFGAFKSGREIRQIPPTFFPAEWHPENFRRIFSEKKLNLGLYYYNSLFIAIWNVVLQLFTSSLLGYVLAKFEFRGKKAFFWFVMSTMMVPYQVIMIPSYLILSKLGLINSRWGLIVPSLINAFGIFLMQQFSRTLPPSLMDSARVEGASEWRIYWQIVLPQIKPALGTLGMLTFMFNWNNYLWPLIVLKDNQVRTLPIILYFFSSKTTRQLELVMAASILIIIPMLIVFLLAQKWVVKGFTLSGLKG